MIFVVSLGAFAESAHNQQRAIRSVFVAFIQRAQSLLGLGEKRDTTDMPSTHKPPGNLGGNIITGQRNTWRSGAGVSFSG